MYVDYYVIKSAKLVQKLEGTSMAAGKCVLGSVIHLL
jgi:hypothetical protein